KTNILLVDDRADKLMALQAVLDDLDQNVIVAKSGKEALRHLLQKEFAVILLDVSMPGMDGFETAQLIRTRPATEHTPIIFVTSMNQSENHIARGYQLGAVDYILTPIVPQVLRSKVSVFVELYKRTEQIKRQGERLRQLEEAALKRQLTDAVDKLEAETKRNRFFNLSLDMLAIADFDGYMLQLNPTWEKTLGFPEDEFKSRPGPDFVHAEDRPAMIDQMNRLREGNSATYFEGRYRCKDGSFRWLGWTAAPFPAERLIYIFARDITQRKTNEQKIESLNAQLKQRVQELTDINSELEAFSYSISHDLRAPLRSMQGFADALLEEQFDRLDDSGKEYARRIVNSAKYMDALLNDLLDYSRLSRAELERVPVDLQREMTELLVQLDSDIQDKRAEVKLDLTLTRVLAHPSTVRQILANLVGNALKFSHPERTPAVSIRTEPCQRAVRIWVEDNGIGIAQEHCDRIFGLFERLHSTQAYPGTGIGLALVRKGAERMGGHAGVESEPERGSRFWIELPAA
ncbi:MAG TPA: ATP-binding protein, partial [Candidatus Limnocylindria bacterium]|nr:ATP-binding protein [Candidatus Limnocylindria bacterium]